MKGFTRFLCAVLAIATALGGLLPLSARADVPGRKGTLSMSLPECTEVPLYLQTDYPDTRYGYGTIESSGCSIVSLAMVATYLTNYPYKPDELAAYFGGRAANNMARMEYGSEKLRLPYVKTWYFDVTMEAIEAGKIAIVLMEEDSIFTESQHFIVLTGMTEDGKILVHDPYGPNYDRWDLKSSFKNGFAKDDILSGFGGAWIYDKASMPKDIFIYSAPRPDRANSRYPDLELSDYELELLAQVVWAEARGESFEGQQAVAEVVFNRMASPDFPDSLEDVIFGENQFRSVPYLEDAEPNQTQYDAIEWALCGPNILPEDVFYFATTPTNENVWGTIGGHIFCYQE